METSENAVCKAAVALHGKAEGMGICKHEKGLLENIQQPSPIPTPREQSP